MTQRGDDLKSALILAIAFAAAGALTVPFLLPTLPPEARRLPLPLPMFCTVLAVQLLVLYGLFAFAGLRLARARGLEPAPELTAIWGGPQPTRHGALPESPSPLALAPGCS